MEYALDIGIADADSIRVVLEYRCEAPVSLFSLDGRPHLKTVHVAATDVAAYQPPGETNPSTLQYLGRHAFRPPGAPLFNRRLDLSADDATLCLFRRVFR